MKYVVHRYKPVHLLSQAGNSIRYEPHGADVVFAVDLEKFDVRRILLDIVPGDGSGHEVYAESREDVEEKLSQMGQQIEDLESQRQDLVLAQEKLAAIAALPRLESPCGDGGAYPAVEDPEGEFLSWESVQKILNQKV